MPLRLTGEAAAAAVVEHKGNKRPVLLYASEWDTPENARKMFEAYRQVLKGKWKQMKIETDTPESLTGSGDDGDFRVSMAGTRVLGGRACLAAEQLR